MNKSMIINYGATRLLGKDREISGEIIHLNGESFYRILNYDRMPPFFMSIVSSSDHWMFISSTGGISCGRKDPDNALFPYYTDDKIHDAYTSTGSKSIFLVHRGGKYSLWEPFRPDLPEVYRTARNLYKNTTGTKLIFEEINLSLNLKFRLMWTVSDRFGFVKRSVLSNLDEDQDVSVRVIDGIRNILPYGVSRTLQSTMSTLLDGYKKCELNSETGLGIYTLSSILTDRAEPSEALKATTVWSAGLQEAVCLLSSDQFQAFLEGLEPETETSLKGRRGGYYVYTDMGLTPGGSRDWIIAADVSQGPSDVPATKNMLGKESDLKSLVLEDVERGNRNLQELVARADGIQKSADSLSTARHFSNTLFNIMRGGIFHRDYQVEPDDFRDFLRNSNTRVYEKHTTFPEKSGKGPIQYTELLKRAKETKDPGLIRLVLEYLPLTFSRRHGDPSRPWNQFSIEVKRPDGSKKLNYQGNWRDIFQNWEALSLSYPGFIESFIARFVNASTIDGYNPYRLTRDGIDWEIHEPENPWSNIGYWGDHQIIYLLKLMELSARYHPGLLREMLSREIFVYANVPYRIMSYEQLRLDASNSIIYDSGLEEVIAGRVAETGSDGKLVYNSSGDLLTVSLGEKILVSLLSKLCNFVPGGGIWMNTQRPEWNDANNALVGNGLSMVTLYYMRRFISMIGELFASVEVPIYIAEEVEILLLEIRKIFSSARKLTVDGITDAGRLELVDKLGQAGSRYRCSIYENGFSERKRELQGDMLKEFFTLCLEFMDHSMASNRRPDKLYHSYNLMEFGKDSCRVSHLDEMLEGQVAVLSSGYLDAKETLQVLDALRESRMYRSDQNSYTLYPDRELPGFLEKNIITGDALASSAWLMNELETGRREVIEKDENGIIHFNGSLRNAEDLEKRLDGLGVIPPEEKEVICNLFIDCFNHRQFTGRSGTLYKYEGLGCIYWHMVSKLLLAVQEVYLDAEKSGEDPLILAGLKAHYDQIKNGLGLDKSPEQYGAFPTDPYSHTPGFSGVQQPGMTGQVKEDILTRFGELGVHIEDGCISFLPSLLSQKEYLEAKAFWEVNGHVIRLEKGELGFTLCGTPVIYKSGRSRSVTLERGGGENEILRNTTVLDKEKSSQIFNRTGNIRCIRVEFGST